MVRLTKEDRVKYNLGSTTKFLTDGDRVLLESGGAISYADLLAQLNADITVSGGGGITRITQRKDENFSVPESDGFYLFNMVTGGITGTMPAGSGNTSYHKFNNQSNETCYLTADGSDLFIQYTTPISSIRINPGEAVNVNWDGTFWVVT